MGSFEKSQKEESGVESEFGDDVGHKSEFRIPLLFELSLARR